MLQQIKGTAMGAVFSPTIANIYMSSIIRSFLLTQPIQPHRVARYIGDIFIIWTDTTETLMSFLHDLNHFHPSLTFTHEHSTASINFLDLTIYKGFNFHITNTLEMKSTKVQTLGAYCISCVESCVHAIARARKLATPRVVAVMRGAVSSRSNTG